MGKISDHGKIIGLRHKFTGTFIPGDALQIRECGRTDFQEVDRGKIRLSAGKNMEPWEIKRIMERVCTFTGACLFVVVVELKVYRGKILPCTRKNIGRCEKALISF